jgi:putative ABC transport system permease protein
MSVLHAFRHRVRVLLRGAAYDRDLADEVQFHLSLDAEHGERGGLAPGAASDAARRRFGNVTYLREETRRQTALSIVDDIVQDIRYAVRAFRRTPGFALAATLTLALGIGATTTIFSVVDGVLLRGLPYRDAGRVVGLWETSDNGGFRLPSYPTFKDWRAESQSWSNAFEEIAFVKGVDVLYRGENGPERMLASSVSPGFFHLLGTPALLGRTFLPDEERAGANRVIVISYNLWQQRFGGDKAIVGKGIPISGAPATVIGVMPRGFAYPDWSMLWQPIATIERTDSSLGRRGVHSDSRTIARLRPGADSARVAAVMRTVEQRLAQAYPNEQAHWTSAVMQPIRDEILGNIKPTLIMLGGAVLLVLLLACANVANLALVRGAARGRELAVRAAIGAGRRRLVRQLLVESLTLAVAGGALGVGFAWVVIRAIRNAANTNLPRASEIVVESRVVVFAVVVTALAALLAGVMPALRATRTAMLARLRSGAHGSVGSRGDVRTRSVLVAAQFALALVLLIGSGLLLRSFAKLQRVDLGFDPENRVAIALFPPAAKYTDAPADLSLYRALLERVANVPGVRDVAIVNHLPISGGYITSPVQVDGRTIDVTRQPEALYRTASESYLHTMGMRVARGRWFTNSDMSERGGFVINEALAKRVWPGADPLGQRVTLRRSSQLRPDFGQPITGTVIGVIKDMKQLSIDGVAAPEVYVPWTLEVWPWITLVAHVQNPAREIPQIRRAILDVEPGLAVAGKSLQGGLVTIESSLTSSIAQRRLATSLVGGFAVAALLLAAIGMYGVISYGVAQRTREMGIRMALGASRRRILRLVLGEGMRLAIAGALLGIVAALASTRLIASLLFGVVPTDPLTFVATPLLLAAVAILATYIPARRATRLDPTLAIRGD